MANDTETNNIVSQAMLASFAKALNEKFNSLKDGNLSNWFLYKPGHVVLFIDSYYQISERGSEDSWSIYSGIINA